MRKTIPFALLLMATLCMASLAQADWNTPGDAYQACSTMSASQAQTFKEGATKTIPDLQVRITTRVLDNGQRIHDIFVSHPQMSPNQIRKALGDASCGPVGKQCD